MGYLFSLATFCLVALATPGPNNIMIMASGLNYGIKDSLPHFLGIVTGFPLMCLIIGLGLGRLIEIYPGFEHLLNVAGILYLLFLSWKIAHTAAPKASSHHDRPLTLIESCLFQWVNIKGWIMCVSAISAFTRPVNFYSELLLITCMFFLIGIFSTTFWLFLGKWLTQVIKKKTHMRVFNVTMALLLVLITIPMIHRELATLKTAFAF